MELERAPKKRVMSDDVKQMLKTKRKEKIFRIKELENQIESMKPTEPVEVPKIRKSHGNNPELVNRLSRIEDLMTKHYDEYRVRKQVKEKLKEEKKKYKEEQDKTMDEDEAEVVQEDIKEVNHKIHMVDYSMLFH